MIKNIFIIAGIYFILLFSLKSPVSGKEKTVETSAVLKKNQDDTFVKVKKVQDPRPKILSTFLHSYHSPLARESDFIIQKADEYDIPWTLVAAISGTESTFCHAVPYGSYNCWGWNNGQAYFSDFREAIDTVSKTLRYGYFEKGLTTPESISHVYAPPSPSWGWKVRHFMNLIEYTTLPLPDPNKLSV